MAERGRGKFRANGTCMYPHLRPGDLFFIDPKNVDDIKIGDIAIFRRGISLIGHRTIAKGHDEIGSYIITKADNSKYPDVCPTYDDDILGVVSSVERKGKKVNPNHKINTVESLYFSLLHGLFSKYNLAQPRILFFTSLIQGSRIYQNIFSLYLNPSNFDLSFIVNLPLNRRSTCDLYRKLTLEGFERQFRDSANSDSLDSWNLIIVTGDNIKLASATFLLQIGERFIARWWITDIHVRLAHRGMGLEKRLLIKAEEILSMSGVNQLFAYIPKEDQITIKLLQSLGFGEERSDLYKPTQDLGSSNEVLPICIVLQKNIERKN
jgi:signal peptidase I